MVKTALAFFALKEGMDRADCQKAISYLNNENNEKSPPPFGCCYQRDLVQKRSFDKIFHCVAICGIPPDASKKPGKILAYLEYFSYARILIELDEAYQGVEFYHVYAIDPTEGKEFSLDIDFAIDENFLRNIVDDDNDYACDKFIEVFNHVFSLLMRKDAEQARAKRELSG